MVTHFETKCQFSTSLWKKSVLYGHSCCRLGCKIVIGLRRSPRVPMCDSHPQNQQRIWPVISERKQEHSSGRLSQTSKRKIYWYSLVVLFITIAEGHGTVTRVFINYFARRSSTRAKDFRRHLVFVSVDVQLQQKVPGVQCTLMSIMENCEFLFLETKGTEFSVTQVSCRRLWCTILA